MHKILFFLISIFSFQVALSQVELTWADFADVNFEAQYNQEYDTHFLMPTFGQKIMGYHGKEVSITGYFLDISGTGEVLLLSSNPMASCFFCGAAGPESIIEVVFNEIPPFITDQVVKVTGTLQLNGDNVDRCNYILKNATGKLIN
ncbi:hypothetical protein [Croceivirga thetidis]|uniref:DUF3299 domain-containing protein n=1 Tax=Croceivirga thetidis TaxID=2721623 RepID=A0ABX1GRC1_9FLAO|nr:hypothetical protein [Croceivirga thetidis]NKI32178.1 hypothetical protein [Croceivirga thetidis]